MRRNYILIILVNFLFTSFAWPNCPDPPQCAPAHYYDPSVEECKKCQENCNVCTTHMACATCFEGYNPAAVAPFNCTKITSVPCKDNQYQDPDDGVCKDCMLNCDRCESIDTCLVCSDGFNRHYNPYTCLYYCEDFICEDGKRGCYKCDPNPLVYENNCLACLNGYYYSAFSQICEKVPFEEICPQPQNQNVSQYFDGYRCKICDTGCDQCLENGTCTLCFPEFVKEDGKCLNNNTTLDNKNKYPAWLWWVVIIGIILICFIIAVIVFYCIHKKRQGKEHFNEEEIDLDLQETIEMQSSIIHNK